MKLGKKQCPHPRCCFPSAKVFTRVAFKQEGNNISKVKREKCSKATPKQLQEGMPP